jgi:hypothetical protein
MTEAEKSADLAAHAARIAAEAPPLSEEQRDRLAAILRPRRVVEKKRITCANGHKEVMLAEFERGGEPAFGLEAGLEWWHENFTPDERKWLDGWKPRGARTRRSIQSIAADAQGEYDTTEAGSRSRAEAHARALGPTGDAAERTRIGLRCPECGRRVVWTSDRLQAFLDSDLSAFCISPPAS